MGRPGPSGRTIPSYLGKSTVGLGLSACQACAHTLLRTSTFCLGSQLLLAWKTVLLPWEDLPVRGRLALVAWEDVLTSWEAALPAPERVPVLPMLPHGCEALPA